MTNNDATSRRMTVRDLRVIITDLPPDTELWAFDSGELTFMPIQLVVHDKRANGLNFWINTEDNPNDL